MFFYMSTEESMSMSVSRSKKHGPAPKSMVDTKYIMVRNGLVKYGVGPVWQGTGTVRTLLDPEVTNKITEFKL